MARFPWRDPVTGDVYELPYVPSSRAELDDMVQRMRAQKEMDVADVGTQARQGVEEKIRSGASQISRDLGLPEIAKEVGGDIDWLANAPVLKPIADAIRAPGGREMARATMPGFEGLEAITGLISGGGALAGAYYDPIKERLASEEKAPLPDIPGIDEIIGNEALEGAPAALEMVAPIDLISAGATSAAAGAARAPLRALRAAAPALSRTATAADIFEALVGGGQAAHGLAEGNVPEAIMGGVRMAGGAAGALPGHIAQADIGAATRRGLEDVAPLLETTARDMGYTDLPVPVSRMAEEGKFFKPGEVNDLIEGIGKPSKPEPTDVDLREAKAYLESYRKLSEGKTPTEIITDEKTGHKIELFGDPESPETSTFIVRNPDGSIAAGLGAQSGGLMTWGKNFDAPLEGATGAVRRAAEGKGVRSIGVLTPMGEAAAARFKAKTGAPPERQFGEPPKGPDEEGRYDVDDLPSDEEDFITGIGARRPKETGPDVSTTEGPAPRGSVEPEVLTPSDWTPDTGTDFTDDLIKRWKHEGFSHEWADDFDGMKWREFSPEELSRIEKEVPDLVERTPDLRDAIEATKLSSSRPIDVKATVVQPPERGLPAGETHVRLADEDQGYTYHSTDRVENLEGILKEGLRPGHASNVKGQGTSGPYVVVYGGRQGGLREVSHRPGDFMGSVKGKPKAIIVDPEAFVENKPLDVLEKEALDASEALDAYLRSKNVPFKKSTRGDFDLPDLESPEMAALQNDITYKRLERAQGRTSDAYYEAADNPDYQARTTDDYYNEAKAIADKHGVPVIRGVMDEDGNLTVPRGSLRGSGVKSKVYHGTPFEYEGVPKTEFSGRASETADSPGSTFYTSDRGVAEQYSKLPQSENEPHTEAITDRIVELEKRGLSTDEARKVAGRVIEGDIQFENPMVVDRGSKLWDETEYRNLIDEAKSKGHDGLIIRNTKEAWAEGKTPRNVADTYVSFRDGQFKVPEVPGEPQNAVHPRSAEGLEDVPPLEGGVPVQRGVQGVQDSVQPPPLPPGAAPSKVSVGEPPLRGKSLSQVIDEALAESEAKVPPKLPEGAAPLKSSNREVPPLPKKGQSFADYMTEKFGERPTSSKERAIARAEWNKIRDERKILRLAEAAGIPPDKLKETMRGAPKEGGPETGRLSAWARFAYPVIENFETVHPWLKNVFTKYVKEAETPAMKNIAEAYRIKQTLNTAEQRHVVDILDGKKGLDADTPANVRQAAIAYRHMLDQTWSDAVASGTRRAKDRKRASYFPHKFAEGWDDNLVQNIFLDKNWNLRESSLEKARLSKRADYRRDLDVLDEYFLSAYRRIAEVQNFGKRLEVLRRFAKKHVTDKTTAEWLQTNIRRIMGREHLGGFERFAGHARHIQALSDLGFAAFYQPIQAINTTLYGGLGRSMRAIKAVVKNAPDEVYDAIRSRSLVPDITQELVAGAYGAREGIPSRALQKFMWGIPTIDRWTRIHANTVGKMMVGDALKGKLKAVDDIRALGFDDVKTLADLQKKVDAEPDFALEVGRALSDKALFRSGAMELPGWSSSTSGKLATQYMRFMYRHSLFVRDIFTAAAKGNVRPLARFLTVAPVAITGMAEVLYPIREALREGLRQTVQDDEFDTEKIFSAAVGDELNFDDEIKWRDVLRNKRIPWDHPLKRLLQNVSMWGGIGVFQVALERMMGASGSPVEVGSKLTGAVPSNILEGAGSVIRDLNTLPEDVEWDMPPFKQTRRWGAEQVPLVGHSLARRMRDELGE